MSAAPAIYYLGPEGTFSHILARKRFGRKARLEACSTIDGIFEQVMASEDALGLVPIENSSGGTIYDTVDLLIRHGGKLSIREELALDIRIALMGHAKENVTTIYSHFIQLKHHADWLKKRWPRAQLKAVSSTALAAHKAASNPRAAALASPGAAEIYGLKILQPPAAKGEVNVTNFFVLGKTPAVSTGQPALKTALVAALPNTTGSLHHFLGPFARQGVSLTRIVSRPVPGQPQTYVFFIEIDGGPEDSRVQRALARGARLAETLVSLGTYPAGGHFKS